MKCNILLSAVMLLLAVSCSNTETQNDMSENKSIGGSDDPQGDQILSGQST